MFTRITEAGALLSALAAVWLTAQHYLGDQPALGLVFAAAAAALFRVAYLNRD